MHLNRSIAVAAAATTLSLLPVPALAHRPTETFEL
jgi:hypothetical protein